MVKVNERQTQKGQFGWEIEDENILQWSTIGVGEYIYRSLTPPLNHTNRPESRKDTIHSQYTFYSTNFQIEKLEQRKTQGHEVRKCAAEAAYSTERVNFALWNSHGNDNVVMRKLK